MNKLFRKASVALAGLAMAVGVGFAISGSKTAIGADADNAKNYVPTELAVGKKVLIVSHATSGTTSGTYYYMTGNQQFSSSGPTYGTATFADNKLTGDLDDHLFTVGGGADAWTFTTVTGSYKLYCTGDNNGLRLTTGGSSSYEAFTYATGNGKKTLFNNGRSRFVGVYTAGTNWRSYTTSNSSGYSGTGETVEFFVEEDSGKKKLDSPAPVYDKENNRITWENVNNATGYQVKIDDGEYSEESSPLSLSDKGFAPSTAHTVKVKATDSSNTYADSDNGTVSFAIFAHAGTEGDPYSVVDARAAIDANYQTSGVYVSGFVSSIPTPYSQEYSNITFNMVDGLGDDTFLQAFRCGGTNADKVELRGKATVSGNLTKFNSTYEFEAGCQLTSWTYPNYSVVYNANGATGGDVPTDSTEYARNAEVTVAANTGDLVKTDFAFNGWNTEADGSGNHYDAGTGTFQITTNTTLYAEWTPVVPMIVVDDEYSGTIGDAYDLPFTYANLDKANLSVVSSNSNVVVGAITANDGNAHVAITLAKIGSAILSFKNGEEELANCEITVEPVLYNCFWDLATASYEEGVTAELITWKTPYAVMEGAKGEGNTDVNNYIPPDKTSTRFYANNILTITPSIGYTVRSIVFTATTNGYATALANSTWTNASAVASNTTVTVTPTVGTNPIVATLGGTTGITNVKIFYNEHWCESFLSTFTCSGVTVQNPDGAITVANPTNVWNSFAASIDDNLKAELRSLVANEGGNEKEQAMARYDLVVRKYGTGTYQDFIGRFAEGGVNYAFVAPMGGNNTPNVLLLVAITGFGLIAASGVFFALRKRKER